MGATFTIEEKVSLNNLASQIAQVTVLASTLANYSWANLPGKPSTIVYTDQLYSDPAWLSISKSFVGLGNVENTALSTWAGTTNIRNAGPLTIAGGTQSSTTPFINGSQVWNNAAVTFTGIYSNVTDTASNAASLLMDLQVGGVSKTSIKKDGTLTVFNVTIGSALNLSAVNPTISIGSGTLLFSGDFSLGARAGGLFVVSSSGAYSWSSSTAYNVTPDTYLYRDAAATLAQRNGVNAQSFRIYNTYTDSLNYERGNLDWIKYANNLTLSTQSAGTGTTRGLILEAANGQISFFTSGASWQILAGVLRVAADNTGAIGGLNSNRPQNVYSYGGLKATGTASSIEAWNTNAATSTVDYEKGVFDWTTNANTLTIGSVAGGTGTARSTLYSSASAATLQSRTNGISIDSASGLTLFQKAGVSVWQITTAGTFGTQTDGGQDIGNAGGQRPNNLNMLGTVNMYSATPTINTPNGALRLTAATTGKASLNIPSGTAPTTPADGDIWSDGTNLKIRLGGVTYTIQKV